MGVLPAMVLGLNGYETITLLCAILAVAVAVSSAYYAHHANVKADKANALSSKANELAKHSAELAKKELEAKSKPDIRIAHRLVGRNETRVEIVITNTGGKTAMLTELTIVKCKVLTGGTRPKPIDDEWADLAEQCKDKFPGDLRDGDSIRIESELPGRFYDCDLELEWEFEGDTRTESHSLKRSNSKIAFDQ